MAAMKPHGLHTPKPARKGTPVRDELLSWFSAAMFISGVMFWAEAIAKNYGIALGWWGFWLFWGVCIFWAFPCIESLQRYYGSE